MINAKQMSSSCRQRWSELTGSIQPLIAAEAVTCAADLLFEDTLFWTPHKSQLYETIGVHPLGVHGRPAGLCMMRKCTFGKERINARGRFTSRKH
jgi:hypothetical protein